MEESQLSAVPRPKVNPEQSALNTSLALAAFRPRQPLTHPLCTQGQAMNTLSLECTALPRASWGRGWAVRRKTLPFSHSTAL